MKKTKPKTKKPLPFLITGHSVTVSNVEIMSVEQALSATVMKMIMEMEIKRNDVAMIDTVLYGRKVTIIVKK